jgi:hypothetical protein
MQKKVLPDSQLTKYPLNQIWKLVEDSLSTEVHLNQAQYSP